MPKLGHLAHEDAAEDMAGMALDWLDGVMRCQCAKVGIMPKLGRMRKPPKTWPG